MTYWCEECVREVTSPRYIKVEEVHWEVDTRRIEEVETVVCPHCGHELDEANKCDICGEPCSPDHWICEWCAATIKTEYEEMLKRIASLLNTTDAENAFNEWCAEYID